MRNKRYDDKANLVACHLRLVVSFPASARAPMWCLVWTWRGWEGVK